MRNQRQTILSILNNFFPRPGDLENLISYYTKDYNSQEIGFINTVVRGSVRYGYQLDYIIRKLSKLRFSRIDESIKNILRMSLYQLIYMDHIPDFAIVNEAVELAKEIKVKNSSSYVNGILRNFIRNKDEIMDFSNIHYKDRLRTQYSYPDWMVDLFLEVYPDNVEEMLDSYNREPRFDIRNNSLKLSRDQLKNSLEKEGFIVKVLDNTSNGLAIENPQGIIDNNLFKHGYFYIQSESSQKVGDLADLSGVKSVLDVCGAPGGKTSHIYEKAGGNIKIISCDISQEKIDLIEENKKRLGHNNIEVRLQDGREYNEDFKGKFDLVLLDSPCSALGLIRKYPEMKYTKSLEDINSLVKIQKELLKINSKYVKKSGTLIYSTCSFTRAENENIIFDFLEDNKNFSLHGNIVRLNPLVNDSDGFTIGVLKGES